MSMGHVGIEAEIGGELARRPEWMRPGGDWRVASELVGLTQFGVFGTLKVFSAPLDDFE